jgi:putative aldouronate transport system permease protein
MALPGLLFFAVFCYAPIPGIVIAFKDFNFEDGIFRSPWNNFDNFRAFLSSPALFRTVKNTLVLNVLMISTSLLFQLGMALLLNEIRGRLFKRGTQSIMIFPYFISFIVVAVIFYELLDFQNGVVNRVLKQVGLEPVKWYQSADAWLFIYLGAQIWKNTGYGSIIYLAAITSIDQEMYDSALIDGAGRFQQARYITIPSIRAVITILLLLSVGHIFSTDVGSIYALIGDNSLLFKHLDTVDLYIFRVLRIQPDIGQSTAVGLMQSIMGFFFVVAANRIVKRLYPEGAIY